MKTGLMWSRLGLMSPKQERARLVTYRTFWHVAGV